HVIEANPRASRTVPFVSKAIGAPLAKVACRLMLGERLADQDVPDAPAGHVSVKEAVMPFARFAGADAVLGPEMKSTGEVMGIAPDFPTAFGKAQSAARVSLPREGTIFITVTDTDKPAATQLAARFHDMGFEVIATHGTAQAISRMGVPVKAVNNVAAASPHVDDYVRGGGVGILVRGRVMAPFGRRLCEVVEARDSGGYRVFSALDVGGPRPAAGQFYMLAADRGWGGSGGRPYLSRAFAAAGAEEGSGGV